MTLQKAVFLDRDGTLTKDDGYTHKVEDLFFLPTTFAALRKLIEHDYLLIMVTNQSGIARGLFSESDFQAFQNKCMEVLANEKIQIAKTYFCPHHPDFGDKKHCDCRKPLPGMLNQGLSEFNCDPRACLMIGNAVSDILAGQAAGIQTGFLGEMSALKGVSPTYSGNTLLEIVNQFLNRV